MGIRVVCPNGHRLNLKSHLAGHRGLCPDCGARFRIPFESSDQPQPREERGEGEVREAGDILEQPQVPAPSEIATTSEPEIQALSPGQPMTSDVFSAEATWYVQVPDGERFGPANSDFMKAWIAEGRVLPDYLVWRDGWSEWQSASTILGQDRAEIPATSFDGFVDSDRVQQYTRRRNSQAKAAWLILLLLVGLVLLGGVGLAIMTGQISF